MVGGVLPGGAAGMMAQGAASALGRAEGETLGEDALLAAGYELRVREPRHRLVRGLVGEAGRIVAGEAMVGELRPHRIALLETHGAVDAVHRHEGQGVRADQVAHLLQRMRGGEQAGAVGAAVEKVKGLVVGGLGLPGWTLPVHGWPRG